jgi:membrane-bound lytic murein transglycosylase A
MEDPVLHARMAHSASLLRSWLLISVGLATLLAGAQGCQKKAIDFSQQLPPGQLALRKISPGEYPDFTINSADLPALAKSIDNSIKYMASPSSKQFFPYLDITYERAVATLQELRAKVEELQRTEGASSQALSLNKYIAQNFEVYQSIGAPDPEGKGYTNKVLFTGYFTPIYNASLTRQGPYQYPLYKRPADLVTDPSTLDTLGRRAPDGKIVPYYTRQEIEQGQVLAGQELVWLASRWEAYVITIQGSARLKLTDGRTYEIGFAGLNGYDYSSPGEQMVKDGALKPEEHNAKAMAAYFRAHPQDMDKYLSLNQRYVFFTERPGGPFGCLNVPVTPRASIATDKAVYPRAMPAFLSVPVPTDESGTTSDYRGFMMDQDRGGAIRAAGRCDIFMGVGEQAGRVAGHQLHEGHLYYIAIKPELIQPQTAPVASAAMLPR